MGLTWLEESSTSPLSRMYISVPTSPSLYMMSPFIAWKGLSAEASEMIAFSSSCANLHKAQKHQHQKHKGGSIRDQMLNCCR